MAAYRRVDGLVICGLTACTPGSAPGPTLGNEYGRTLPLVASLKQSLGWLRACLLLKLPVGTYSCVLLTVFFCHKFNLIYGSRVV